MTEYFPQITFKRVLSPVPRQEAVLRLPDREGQEGQNLAGGVRMLDLGWEKQCPELLSKLDSRVVCSCHICNSEFEWLAPGHTAGLGSASL